MNFLGVAIVSPFVYNFSSGRFWVVWIRGGVGVEIVLKLKVEFEAEKTFAEVLDDPTTRRRRDERVVGFDN